MKITKPEVNKHVAELSSLTLGETNRAIRSLVTVIQRAMKSGEVVSLSGLGSFRAKARKAKKSRNPKTGEVILVPPGRKISFKTSKTLRRMINHPTT
jgi:nucleoid DNA-binding protein